MVKKVLYCALSIAILLPLFTFSVFAADSNSFVDCFTNDNGDFTGPVPPYVYNRKFGTNICWYDLFYQSNVQSYLSMCGDFSYDDTEFWGTDVTGTDEVTLVYFDVDSTDGSSTLEFSIDFSGTESYNKIFDLSKLGYVQFWWQLAVRGYTDSGGSPNPTLVNVHLYGNETGTDGSGTHEYIKLDRDLLPVGYTLPDGTSLSDGNRFKYFWGAAYGATVTSSIMRSQFINCIHISVTFASPVDYAKVYLSDINVRTYDTSGESLDDPSAPSLSVSDKENADAEGDIQNSIFKVNNRVDDLIWDLEEIFNANLGLENPNRDYMIPFLNDADEIIQMLNRSIDDFDETIDRGFDTLSAWLDSYSDVILYFWNGIPGYITAIVTAVVVFIVIRKVIGR